MNKLKSTKLYHYYYFAVMLGYTLVLFFDWMRPGVFASILMLVVAAELFFRKQIRLSGTVDYLVVMYLVYNLISVIWMTRNGLPVSVFTEEFSNSVLPVVFYMVGKTVGDEIGTYYRWFLVAVLYLCMIGLVLYIWAPQFYLDFLMNGHISKADASTMRVRMNSLVGSTSLGAIACYGMLVSVYDVMKSRKRTIVGIVLLFVNFFFAMMSNQRAAMVVAFMVILYMNWLVFFSFKAIKVKYFFVEIGVLIAGLIGLCVADMDAVVKIYRRLVSLPEAIGQRSEQWVVAMDTLYNVWLGNGLGANGHKALAYEGAHVIADGGLVKLFCEEGVIGFSIFLFILFLVCKAAGKRLKEYYVEIGIIAVALLLSIGSNVLSFQLATPIFWFAVGRCATAIAEKKSEQEVSV